MEYKDANDHSIEEGFYFETFYKGDDEFRNRIVWLTTFAGFEGLYTVSDQRKPVKLNTNYSRWLNPSEDQVPGLVAKLKKSDLEPDLGLDLGSLREAQLANGYSNREL